VSEVPTINLSFHFFLVICAKKPWHMARLWHIVAVDILSVPVSTSGTGCTRLQNGPMPFHCQARKYMGNYTADFTLRSQHNFESTMLKQTFGAFGIQSLMPTPAIPDQAECFNHSLLQFLCTYSEKEFDWEQHLPLALFTYRNTIHSSTGVSPQVLGTYVIPHLSSTLTYISANFESTAGFS